MVCVTFREPKEFNELAKLREENRLRAEEFLLEAEADQFNCANAEKSAKAMVGYRKIYENMCRKDSCSYNATDTNH